MSLYQLNKILYLLEVDAGFLARMKSNVTIQFLHVLAAGVEAPSTRGKQGRLA